MTKVCLQLSLSRVLATIAYCGITLSITKSMDSELVVMLSSVCVVFIVGSALAYRMFKSSVLAMMPLLYVSVLVGNDHFVLPVGAIVLGLVNHDIEWRSIAIAAALVAGSALLVLSLCASRRTLSCAMQLASCVTFLVSWMVLIVPCIAEPWIARCSLPFLLTATLLTLEYFGELIATIMPSHKSDSVNSAMESRSP